MGTLRASMTRFPVSRETLQDFRGSGEKGAGAEREGEHDEVRTRRRSLVEERDEEDERVAVTRDKEKGVYHGEDLGLVPLLIASHSGEIYSGTWHGASNGERIAGKSHWCPGTLPRAQSHPRWSLILGGYVQAQGLWAATQRRKGSIGPCS
ncbi:hypothetical protein NDU88_009039 [Pleurodeles waltl]|uniref:Uncharacterized protein n=1 Tax=Pleurodeles waltl TaxID=8319 RepID=A0AAV7QQH4_PLEWA|nr:hypothetical protein NDU88_009039 [Pleurodeles waltl]